MHVFPSRSCYVGFTLSQMNLALVLLEIYLLPDACIPLSGATKGLKNIS